jgi:hypothetical protein
LSAIGKTNANFKFLTMNFPVPVTSEELLSQAQNENMYLKLIEQINKDFNLANEGIDFPQSTTPEELKIQLHEKIYRLIQHKYTELLNLLYIIDVPEETIKQLDGSNSQELSEQLVYLLLKREWMKVWYKKYY